MSTQPEIVKARRLHQGAVYWLDCTALGGPARLRIRSEYGAFIVEAGFGLPTLWFERRERGDARRRVRALAAALFSPEVQALGGLDAMLDHSIDARRAAERAKRLRDALRTIAAEGLDAPLELRARAGDALHQRHASSAAVWDAQAMALFVAGFSAGGSKPVNRRLQALRAEAS